jgi:hypothetical protein
MVDIINASINLNSLKGSSLDSSYEKSTITAEQKNISYSTKILASPRLPAIEEHTLVNIGSIVNRTRSTLCLDVVSNTSDFFPTLLAIVAPGERGKADYFLEGSKVRFLVRSYNENGKYILDSNMYIDMNQSSVVSKKNNGALRKSCLTFVTNQYLCRSNRSIWCLSKCMDCNVNQRDVLQCSSCEDRSKNFTQVESIQLDLLLKPSSVDSSRLAFGYKVRF